MLTTMKKEMDVMDSKFVNELKNLKRYLLSLTVVRLANFKLNFSLSMHATSLKTYGLLNEFGDNAHDRAAVTETDIDLVAALANDNKSAAKLNSTNSTAESEGAILFCSHDIECCHLFLSLKIINILQAACTYLRPKFPHNNRLLSDVVPLLSPFLALQLTSPIPAH